MNSEKVSNDEQQTICPICLQKFTYPVQLPCNHIFCYLCIKGSVLNSQTSSLKRCALCRQYSYLIINQEIKSLFFKCRAELSEEYFESPNLKSKEILIDSNDDEYHWYYKSNQSEKWWKYDV